MPRNILIVTGSDYTPQVYEAFLRTKQRGDRLFLLSDGCFEPRPGIFEQHFIHNLRHTADVLASMRRQPVRFDAVTIKTSEWLTPLVALLAKEYGCLGNDPAAAFRCRSKYHMRKAMQDHGVPIPQFRLCRTFEELTDAVREVGLPCVAKPVGGNASYGTFLLSSERDMEELPRRYASSIAYLKKKAVGDDVFAFSREEFDLFGIGEYVDMVTDYLVEEFMEGPEISIDALVHDDAVTVMGVAEQVRMAPPFFVQLAEFMPFDCTEETEHTISDLVSRTVEAMGVRHSPTHTEIIFTPQGPKVVEIACRIGGDNIHDAVLQTTGYNLMEEAIAIALGEPRSYSVSAQCHTAMRYLLPQSRGVIGKISVPAGVRTDPDITEIEISVKPGDRVSPPPEAFDFLGYVQARGNSRQEAQKRLDETLSKISIEIA